MRPEMWASTSAAHATTPASIRTPKGERRQLRHASVKLHLLQSTRPRGARRRTALHHRAVEDVSIHAPARGATSRRRGRPGAGSRFNPRAREGRDPRLCHFGASLFVFQSTRPRGARPWSLPPVVDGPHVSIHAPARGATAPVAFLMPSTSCFNPRAREGRDGRGDVSRPRGILFQSTRPRGARRREVDGV